MKKLLMVIPLVFFLCFTVGCQRAEEVAGELAVDVEANKAYKGTILIEFKLGPATIKNSKPVFEYDPRKQFVASIKASGYKVVLKKSKQHNLVLKINYRETNIMQSSSPYTRVEDMESVVFVHQISFILEDSSGTILLKEKRGPFTANIPQELVKSMADNLPNFINERLEAEDEFSFINGLLQREGFNKNRFIRLLELQDPRTAEALLPFLSTCNTQFRWDVRWALEDLGFEPRTAWEKAAFDRVTLQGPWDGHDNKYQISETGYFIAEHGITAIELLIEDLKCTDLTFTITNDAKTYAITNKPRNSLGAIPWKAAINASYGLSDCIKHEWRDRYGSFDHRWNEFAVTSLTDALKAACEDSTNLAAVDEIYIENMIEVLGNIADSRATELLQTYASYPQWVKKANKAIKNIARRSGTLTSIDVYGNERQVEMEYKVMEHSIIRGPFLESDKQITKKLIETAKQKGADAVIIEGVFPYQIYTVEKGKKEREIEVTFIKYKLLN